MTIEIDSGVLVQIADMHALYRMFDGRDNLLYVGVTGRVRRFDEHAVKRWFPAVRRITLDWHPTEAEARKAERVAIRIEAPRYNITGAPPPGQGVLAVAAATPAKRIPEHDVLADVLAVFGTTPGLHWSTLAERLAQRWPDRWQGITKDVISAWCRTLGVASAQVKVTGRNLQGCRRADVEAAATRQIITAGP